MTSTVSHRGGSRRELAQKHIEFEFAASEDFEIAAAPPSSKTDIRNGVSHAAFFPAPITHDLILGEIFDAAHAQAQRQNDNILKLEVYVRENPVMAEMKGIPKILMRAGVYEQSGSTINMEAEEGGGPHRRPARPPQYDGYQRSRKLDKERDEIVARGKLVERTVARLAYEG